MKSRLKLMVGSVCLLSGWFCAFVLNSLQSGYQLYVLAPTLIIAVGLALVWKSHGGKIAALVLAFTALFALLAMNQFFPERSLSIPAIKQRFQNTAEKGHTIAIDIPSAMQKDFSVDAYFLTVFNDLSIDLVAKLPDAAGAIVKGGHNRFFVSIPTLGAIYLIEQNDNTSSFSEPILFAYGLDRPTGLAYLNKHLYVAETTRIIVVNDSGSDAIANYEVVFDGMPDDGGHWRHSLVLDQNNTLYVSVGSRCDACEEDHPWRGTVLQVDRHRGEAEVYAEGLRYVGGLHFRTDTQQLWASENSRRGDGFSLASDEINLLSSNGDYGWPFCYGDKVVDRTFGSADKCEDTIGSIITLPAGSAPGGITFGDGLASDPEFQQSLYIALTGEGTKPSGRIIRVPFKDGKVSNDPLEFIKGYEERTLKWRPRAIMVGDDGALYLTDDVSKAIFRVSLKAKSDKN